MDGLTTMTTRKQIPISITLFLLLSPITVSAATMSFQALPTIIGAGDTVRVTVILDSTIATNAFSGTLLYSETTLEPIAISDGNSLINMWITRPMVTSAGMPITFAGITPGGFSGSDGTLFSVLFRVKAAGTATVSLKDIEVLRNDGVGGNEPTTTKSLTLSIEPKPFGGYTEPTDQIPPEPFTVYKGSDPQLFNGRSYLAFSAVDKGSGVDRYTVAESRIPSFLFLLFPPSWKEAISPYEIVDQRLTSTVYIKAVDRAGNERLSVFPPQRFLTVYEMFAFLVILMLLVFLWRRWWGRR